jgi:hypothetical protein
MMFAYLPDFYFQLFFTTLWQIGLFEFYQWMHERKLFPHAYACRM